MAKRRVRGRAPKPIPIGHLTPEARLAIGVGQLVLDYVFEKLPKGVAVAEDKRNLKELSKELRSKIEKNVREQIAAANKPKTSRRG